MNTPQTLPELAVILYRRTIGWPADGQRSQNIHDGIEGIQTVRGALVELAEAFNRVTPQYNQIDLSQINRGRDDEIKQREGLFLRHGAETFVKSKRIS